MPQTNTAVRHLGLPITAEPGLPVIPRISRAADGEFPEQDTLNAARGILSVAILSSMLWVALIALCLAMPG